MTAVPNNRNEHTQINWNDRLQRNLFLLSSTDNNIRSPKRVQVSVDKPSYQLRRETKILVHIFL